MSDEWGPWVEHDGESVPQLRGKYLHIVFSHGFEAFGPFEKLEYMEMPLEYDDPEAYVIRYRTRKPRGITILQKIVANPEREAAHDILKAELGRA